MDTLLQDLRYGWRLLQRTPAFTAVAVLTLGLGVGANAVMFSVVNTVLLRPLPYREPAELLLLETVDTARRQPWGTAPPDFYTYRAQNRTVEPLAAFYVRPRNLTGAQDPERVAALIVSSDFLTVLGTQPALGREFAGGDEVWGQHRVAILTDGLWRRRYGADPGVVGRSVLVDAEPHVVVGVLPPAFSFLGLGEQVLLPMSFAPGDNLNTHNNYFLTMVGRRKAGSTQAQVAADLGAITEAIIREHPENRDLAVDARPLQESFVEGVRSAVLALMGAVGFVLLIACANLANLLMARAAGRRHEIAVRVALGATRTRLLRQFMAESFLLAGLGGSLGLALAVWGADALNLIGQDVLPRAEAIRVDAAVLAFTLGATLLTGTLFGAVPAGHRMAGRPVDALAGGARTMGEGIARRRLRGALVVAETALSLVLLIGAGLMVKSIYRLMQVEAGFDPERVLTAQVAIPPQKYVDAQLERRFSPLAYSRSAGFFAEAIERVRALPGVRAVGAINGLPLAGEVWGKSITFYDRPLPANVRDLPPIQYRVVAGDYFRALGIRILSGRAFNDQDTLRAPKVAIVNRALVHRYWNDEDPIGREVSANPPSSLVPAGTLPPGYEGPDRFTVVGVADDVRYGGLGSEPVPLLYVPYAQGSEGATNMYLVVKTHGDPMLVAGAVRGAIAQVDPDQPVAGLLTMGTRVEASVASPRLQATVLGAFASLAVLLTAIGIYGVMSYSVTQRTREIGVRMALGAARRDVVAIVLGQGMRLAAIGLALGLLGALALTRVLTSLLFGVTSTDPAVFAGLAAGLAGVALLAAYLPARRAARVDPLRALRCE